MAALPDEKTTPDSSVPAHIEALQQGDPAAFQQFYQEHVRLIYSYIIVRVSNAQDAEDLTSRVFIKAWKALPSFRWTGTPIKTWLLQISHNIVIDHYRKNRPVCELSPDLGEKERALSQIKDRDELRRVMTELSQEQQMILHLHYFEGYNLKEVAHIIGKSPTAVRVDKHRALKRLRKVLQSQRNFISPPPSYQTGPQLALD